MLGNCWITEPLVASQEVLIIELVSYSVTRVMVVNWSKICTDELPQFQNEWSDLMCSVARVAHTCYDVHYSKLRHIMLSLSRYFGPFVWITLCEDGVQARRWETGDISPATFSDWDAVVVWFVYWHLLACAHLLLDICKGTRAEYL
jgi:hypothetical protein